MITEEQRQKVLKALRDSYANLTAEHTTEKEFENIIEAMEIVKNLIIPIVSQRSELLKGDYRQTFIDWKNKYFAYKPKTYDYKSKNSKERHTLADLHRRYERAMLESPFNCG